MRNGKRWREVIVFRVLSSSEKVPTEHLGPMLARYVVREWRILERTPRGTERANWASFFRTEWELLRLSTRKLERLFLSSVTLLAKEVRSTITVAVIANYTTALLKFTELVVVSMSTAISQTVPRKLIIIIHITIVLVDKQFKISKHSQGERPSENNISNYDKAQIQSSVLRTLPLALLLTAVMISVTSSAIALQMLHSEATPPAHGAPSENPTGAASVNPQDSSSLKLSRSLKSPPTQERATI